MKRKSILLFFSLAMIFCARAQQTEDTLLGRMKLNFVVPDMPAFKVLGTDPSNLLRPSTPKALALSMSSFAEGGKFIIPKAFALEISPALLLNSNKGPAQLVQYAKNAVLNSFRISIGSSSDSSISTSARSLAVGLRISLINDGDFGTDNKAHEAIASELRKFRKQIEKGEALKEFAIASGLKKEYENTADKDEFQDKYKVEFNKYLANADQVNQKEFLAAVKRLKEEYKKKHWNDDKLDLAFAVLSSSPDSIVKNLRFSQAQLWLTWAKKIGKDNRSQLLIGLNSQITKDLKDTIKSRLSNSYFNLSVPLRFLYGTNRVKGFVEGQYNYSGQLKESNLLLSLGTEINIIDGVWVNLYGGFKYNSKSSGTSTVVNLNLKLTMPEKFGFF